ncbi:uncharacterized protein K02A2.6-like [Wyeomyia smithii]|uniref:uncharacterized protein K02A2.6-like n=1 Tax=Wyeomyia smithii TaxID=174621 RepID=UPI002467B521|nr:uncharacterized protein K02A2.6-like [Wyeomyia smithii]
MAIYDYDIIYRPSSKLGNADFCPRFPFEQQVPTKFAREYVKNLNFTEEFPINYKEIAKETEKDEFLQTIMNFLRKGWPERLERQFKEVYSHHLDLEVVEGCILFNDRVIIPESMKRRILKMLHVNHAGMTKIKQLARRTVYWFGMNSDISEYVTSCRICKEINAVPSRAKYSKWIPTNKPFARLHADFFFLQGKTYLLIVDSHTKWLEVEQMKGKTEAWDVIKVFVKLFARFGFPEVIVTDGGPPFSARKFITFLEGHDIQVLKSPPYHPESNGQAERMVRLIKNVLKNFLLDPEIRGLETDLQLPYFLFNYRNTCVDAEGNFPSEKLFSFEPRTLLDLINPKITPKKQLTKEHESDSNTTYKKENKTDVYTQLKNGDEKRIRKWLPATFLRHLSDTVLQISLGGRIISAHRRQIKPPTTSRQQTRKRVVFQEENFVDPNHNPNPAPPHGNVSSTKFNKRKRDEEQFHEKEPESDPEYYGFAAESCIYRSEPDSKEASESIRKSRRMHKKRRIQDFHYY